MGATVGAAAVAAGAKVIWATHQRSESTHSRAEKAGLSGVENLPQLVRESEVILSVCPPHAAFDVAQEVMQLDFRGLYVDANAVSPETAFGIASRVTAGGASFVDGGIIGPPVKRSGTTRLYLSGVRAREAADVFEGSWLDARVLGREPGAASAIKMAYAAWTKCSDALLLGIRSLASMAGVDEALVQEWSLSQPQLAGWSTKAAESSAPKAWRYAGEMKEIAATFGSAGLPTGFHLAAAEIFSRLESFKNRTESPPALKEVVASLCESSAAHKGRTT
ncbi:MAG: DUF1932 domain-containing protein [Deltaproteobacteria bacterium]|nr:DUF1932 domain-containing protein [Deltaproteobacteria bacterium]